MLGPRARRRLAGWSASVSLALTPPGRRRTSRLEAGAPMRGALFVLLSLLVLPSAYA